MIVVGLTGGIGSGKSFIASIFAELGIPVYSSDIRAKELMQTDSEIIEGLINMFGNEVFENRQLNRKLIADAVFTNKNLLKTINELVHPRVQADFENWCMNQKTVKFVVKEAAILVESGVYKKCDYLIVVTAPIETRIKRIMERDNLSYNEIALRIENQINDKERLNYAHFVIDNDGETEVKPQVEAIIEQLLKHNI